jgi:hypothetical protein
MAVECAGAEEQTPQGRLERALILETGLMDKCGKKE